MPGSYFWLRHAEDPRDEGTFLVEKWTCYTYPRSKIGKIMQT